MDYYRVAGGIEYCNIKVEMKLVIVGGGESGVGAALLAKKEGYDVFLSDGSSLKENYRKELREAEISFEEGGHSLEKF